MGRIFILMILLCSAQTVWAQECVSIPVENPFSGQDEAEVWCRDLRNSEARVYWRQNLTETVLPEDLILQTKDGSWVHSSLAKGQRLVVRTKGLDLVPFNIKEHLQTFEKFPRALMKGQAVDPKRSLQLLQAAKVVQTRKLTEGVFSAQLTADRLPFGGYWWPYEKLELASGAYSPLGKFDRWYLQNFNKPNESHQWEAQNHNLQQVSWGGHCNGWAASSILYPEPNEAVADPVSKIVFLPSDLKGILASTSFCVNWAFYGKRYRQPGDDLKDISPDRFHKLLEHYILNLNKPIAFDYFSKAEVDNNIITGYRLTITNEGPNIFHVDASIQAADYDHARSEDAGPAKGRSFYYSYRLTTDAAGEIVSGSWISAENPDFLWVPVSQANCGRENPHLDFQKVNKILQLPKAAEQSFNFFREIEMKILPGQHQVLSTGMNFPEGPDGKLFYELKVQGDTAIQLYVSGKEHLIYPRRYSTEADFGMYLNQGPGVISFAGIRPQQLIVTNYGTEAVQFKIKFLNYNWIGIQ